MECVDDDDVDDGIDDDGVDGMVDDVVAAAAVMAWRWEGVYKARVLRSTFIKSMHRDKSNQQFASYLQERRVEGGGGEE